MTPQTKWLTHASPRFRAVVAGFAGFVIASARDLPTRTPTRPIATIDDTLFAVTVASLADSIHSIDKMIGTTDRSIRLRIDPRPLRVRAPGTFVETVIAMGEVVLDSLDARDRANRIAKVHASGFDVGDLDALNRCPAAEVSPPDVTPVVSPPGPCSLAPAAAAGIGVETQTTHDAKVHVLILAVFPYRQAFAADFNFVNDSTWRLARRSPWIIAE